MSSMAMMHTRLNGGEQRCVARVDPQFTFATRYLTAFLAHDERHTNDNVRLRYFDANHQMRTGSNATVPGLPLEEHYIQR